MTSFSEIRRALEPAARVLVASHIRPDGDAYGCTIAMALHLRAMGKEVAAWNEDGMTAKFSYLPHAQMVVPPPAQPEEFDVFLALDTSTRERLGSVLEGIAGRPLLINMDHHVSNTRYGDLNHVDPDAPATGQILFEYLREAGADLGGGIAENLYAAISTDTGSFQYAGTGPRTFAAASALVEAGVDVPGLSRLMYDNHPRRRLGLLRHALNSARFDCDDRIVSFCLTRADTAALGVLPEDNEGIIDHLRAIEGVVAAVFFEEIEDGRVRVSARSKDPAVDVCSVCAQFGGGGHPLAAGARMRGDIGEAADRFLSALCAEVRHGD
jgi:phosphoesterase RecJ-like protein